jgi:hypothetical protein
MGLSKIYITSNTTWTCPSNVNEIIVIGAGGGGGGCGAGVNGQFGGSGGGGSAQFVSIVSVVPGSIYTITVGLGGQGGLGSSANKLGNSGQDGGDTTIQDSNSKYLYVARGSGGGLNNTLGGTNFNKLNTTFADLSLSNIPGGGGNGGSNASAGLDNFINGNNHLSSQQFVGGLAGANSGIRKGGAGGGAGPAGSGGNGGNAESYNVGKDGSSAPLIVVLVVVVVELGLLLEVEVVMVDPDTFILYIHLM